MIKKNIKHNKLLKSGDHWLLLDPSGDGPLLHVLLAAVLEVILVEDGLQLATPLAELQGLGDVANVDAVELDETGTVPEDGGDVHDASAGPVDLPVVIPGPGEGTGELPILGQVQGHLLQSRHGEVDVEGAG